MKKNSLLLTAAILGIACIVATRIWKNRSSPSNKEDTFVVGMISGWPPYMSITNSGAYEGFDVDVAHAIADQLGKKLTIIDTGSLAALFIALDQGKIDVALSGLDITRKRLETLGMVRYVGSDVQAMDLLFWNAIPEGFATMQDFQKLKLPVVAYEPGSTSEKFLDQYDFIEKKALSSITDMVLDLKYSKSLAAIVEPHVGNQLKAKNPELHIVQVPLPANLQIYGCGIAIKKENKTLTKTIETVIAALKKNGTLKKLENRWSLEA